MVFAERLHMVADLVRCRSDAEVSDVEQTDHRLATMRVQIDHRKEIEAVVTIPVDDHGRGLVRQTGLEIPPSGGDELDGKALLKGRQCSVRFGPDSGAAAPRSAGRHCDSRSKSAPWPPLDAPPSRASRVISGQ